MWRTLALAGRQLCALETRARKQCLGVASHLFTLRVRGVLSETRGAAGQSPRAGGALRGTPCGTGCPQHAAAACAAPILGPSFRSGSPRNSLPQREPDALSGHFGMSIAARLLLIKLRNREPAPKCDPLEMSRVPAHDFPGKSEKPWFGNSGRRYTKGRQRSANI